VTLRLELG
jgi:hypothetical protein